jgi:hypothetical protein
MVRAKIIITRDGPTESRRAIVRELTVETDSDKRLTTSRAARLLARSVPGFRRRKGRNARMDGVDVLPVMEAAGEGWCAWRLETGDDAPSGYEPPVPGRVGKLNSASNSFANRKTGKWQQAVISEVQSGDAAKTR